MKIKALFLGLFFLLPILSWTQPYEITEVDIFSLKKPISAKDITVYGISIENSLQEVLDKFGKNVSDLTSSEPEKYYFLRISNGVTIRSTDKKTIDAIFLGPDFKDNLKGKTADFFNLTKPEGLERYITSWLGKPDRRYFQSSKKYDMDIFYYFDGFVFCGMFFPFTSPYHYFELVSNEGLRQKFKSPARDLDTLAEEFISIKSEVLRGLNEIPIVLEDPGEGGTKIGLTSNRMRTVTELKLRKEGIKIIEKSTSVSYCFLCVNTMIVGNAFRVELELVEKVKISRLDVFYAATTWQNGIIGTHGNDPEYIISALGELLDIFLNDYYKANPRK